MSDPVHPTELRSLLEDLRAHIAWHQDQGWEEVLSEPPAQRSVAHPIAVTSTYFQKSTPPPSAAAASATPSVPAPSVRRPAATGTQAVPVGQDPVVAAKSPLERAGEVRTLDEIRREIGDCRRCKLCQGRTQIVFGTGNPRAELVFVGEGPGADEDAQGVPFVGKAGGLLTKMIEAMGYSRDQVYICNVVKCRPEGNRNPEPDEIEACEPFLKAQLAAVRPKVIVALGKFAAQTLLREETPITRLRGNWRDYEGIPLMPTFHPAYLLRNPAEKRAAWMDLQQVMKKLGKAPGAGG